jgi:lysozyme family protein
MRLRVRPDTKERMMDARINETSTADLAGEVGALATGLGILSTTFFPLALPALAFALLVALPLIVLALPAVTIWLLARGVARLLGHRRAASDDNRRAEAPREA